MLRRYLLDGEHVVTAVHQHWAKVAEPVASGVLGLVLALWLDSLLPASVGHAGDVLWWIWILVVVRAAWRLLEWRHDWFVATDKRLILTYGMVTHKVAMMPLSKVTDMSYNRSLMGRVAGFGTFVMESAGQDQALHHVRWVPQPDHTYRAICAEIFGVDDRDRVDLGDGDDDDARMRETPAVRAPVLPAVRAAVSQGRGARRSRPRPAAPATGRPASGSARWSPVSPATGRARRRRAGRRWRPVPLPEPRPAAPQQPGRRHRPDPPSAAAHRSLIAPRVTRVASGPGSRSSRAG